MLQVIAVGLWIVYIGCSIFKPELEPVAAALAGAIVLLLSFFVSNTPISSLTSEETKSAREKHNRQHMLELVKNSWVKDVLEQSLHEAVLIELGQYEEALDHLETILRVNPRLLRPLGLAAQAHLGLGQNREARKYLEQLEKALIKADPDYPCRVRVDGLREEINAP